MCMHSTIIVHTQLSCFSDACIENRLYYTFLFGLVRLPKGKCVCVFEPKPRFAWCTSTIVRQTLTYEAIANVNCVDRRSYRNSKKPTEDRIIVDDVVTQKAHVSNVQSYQMQLDVSFKFSTARPQLCLNT